MLKKENRLTKDKEFDNIFKHGRSSYTKTLGIKTVKNNLSVNRFGILVSTKVSPKAVVRNKIKRQIRAIIQDELFLLKVGFDCAIVVFPLILANNYQEIEATIKTCFKKLNLYDKTV